MSWGIHGTGGIRDSGNPGTQHKLRALILAHFLQVICHLRFWDPTELRAPDPAVDVFDDL